jgi:hypothetical protein
LQNLLERLYEAPKRFGRKALAGMRLMRPTGLLNTCWSRETFLAKHAASKPKQKMRSAYAARALIITLSQPAKRRLGPSDALYILPFLAYTVLLYLAIALKTPVLFVTSWLIVTVGMVITIWLDDVLSVKEKMELTAFTPLVFNLWIITSR